MSSAITRLIYLVIIRDLDSILEASELCWNKAFQAYGSTKSMLSGMKRLRWDVWLEASVVPADHCGVAMGVLGRRIDSVGADKGMSRASYFARAGRLWLPELIRCPSCGAGFAS